MDSPRPHNRTIVIGGMYRSASTYVFNCARVLAIHAGREVWGGSREAFMSTTGHEADVYLVKTHPYMEALAEYADDILLSYRPPAQAWRSLNRFNEAKGNEKIEWQRTRIWTEWLGQWKQHDACRYVLEWDDFAEDDGPWNALKNIAHVLGFDHINLVKVMKHLRSDLAPPAEGQDPDTLVFADHYTSADYEDDIKPRLTVPDRDRDG